MGEGQRLRHPPSSDGGCSAPVPLFAGWLVLPQCHCVWGMMDAFLKGVQSEGLGKICVWEGPEGQCRKINLLMPRWEDYVCKVSMKKRPCM